MILLFAFLTILISLLDISTAEASVSDLDNTKPTNPIDPKTESPTDQSGKENTINNDLAKPEAGTQNQDETGAETSGNNEATSEEKPNLKLRPFINCDLNYSPSCIGTQMSDTILGGKYPDQIQGLGGSDWINASGGNDFVHGGGSNDIIYGEKGDDILYGDDGSDKIFGGFGSDQLFGGPADDKIFEGNGEEKSDFSSDFIDCGSGNDEIWLSLGDHQKDCEKINVNHPN